MPKIVLLNGPPRSGKDTAGNAILAEVGGVRMKFSDPLKAGVHASYGLTVPVDYFEDVKDQIRSEFLGLTPRQAYIRHSEEYMKPLHGKDVYGRLMANRIKACQEEGLIVVPDSGFVEEALPVLDLVGRENVLLIRCHREGKTYDDDSRSYLELARVTTFDVTNPEGNPEWFCNFVVDCVESVLLN